MLRVDGGLSRELPLPLSPVTKAPPPQSGAAASKKEEAFDVCLGCSGTGFATPRT